MASYQAASGSYLLILSSGYKRVVGDQVIDVPGKRVKFTNHWFHTKDKELIEELDGLLTGHRAYNWRKRFWRTDTIAETPVQKEIPPSTMSKKMDVRRASIKKPAMNVGMKMTTTSETEGVTPEVKPEPEGA